MTTFAARSNTLCEAFQLTVGRNPDAVAVQEFEGGALTFGEWAEQVRGLAGGFAGLGIGAGDAVALMMTNRPEFYPVDVACQHLGAVPFSIYNTSSPEQVNYLFADSGARIVVCEKQYLAVVRKAAAGTAIERIVCVDGNEADTLDLAAVVSSAAADFDFESSWRAVGPDDTLTLIYTSGTTGSPKGVQLTHANMLAMVDGTEQIVNSDADDRVLSYLPSAHIADRWSALYHLMVVGNQVTTVADHRKLAAALPAVRPTIFGSVPQVWQKLKAGIDAKLGEATGVKAALAHWAIATGRKASDARLAGQTPSPVLRVQLGLADKLVLAKLRAALGLDSVKLAVSGAAPISAEILRFFNGLGIPATDGWGMSETSGIITCARPGKLRPGTVGTPLPNVELSLAEDGEILVRGAILMKGYLNKPEQTAEMFDSEGWLRTGDIGEFDADGYLKVIDRKKELIVNAGGKNMSPSVIENWVKSFSPLVGQAIAIGDNRKYNVAIIALDPESALAYAETHNLPTTPAELAAHPDIIALMDDAVHQANSKLSRIEQIKRFRIVPDFWLPGSEVLTPTMKPRRKQINERYAATIEELYA